MITNISKKISMEAIRDGLYKYSISILLGIILILFIRWLTVWAENPNPILPVNKLKDLAQQIKVAEENLLNIKITSEAWGEKRELLSDPWQRTPVYQSSTAWFSGILDNKARVDVSKDIIEVSDGTTLSYRESSYSVGFDGQYGRLVRHTAGYYGETFSRNEGQLLSTVPEELESKRIGTLTGKNVSLQFARIGNDYRFSQIFQWADDPKTKVLSSFEFTRELFEGVRSIKIKTKAKSSQESWWLDPGRGFALIGHEYIKTFKDGSKRVMFQAKVSKLKEVSTGIWWPMEVTIESNLPSPLEPPEKNNYNRFVWHASNVVANDPAFKDSIFTVPFPEGYLIDDKVNNIQYRVDKDTALLQQK